MSSVSEYYRAEELPEALELLAQHGERATLLAGGTDVMVWIQSDRFVPDVVIDIWNVRPACAAIEDCGDFVRVGALASYAEIIDSAPLRRWHPLLVEAAREIGAAQIQNRGTMGGNVGGSSPAGDTLPVLLAYDAEVELASLAGERAVPYREFCTGYRETARRADEMIVGFRLPKVPDGAVQRWYKVGTRLAQAISKTMLAGVGALDADGCVAWVRIGVGSVAPVPVLCDSVAKAVTGRRLDAQALAEARRRTHDDISPIDDVRSTREYRAKVTENLVARFLSALGAGAPSRE
jgi:CO/xanthine dehydrogenase FAD-binding subunit